MSIRIKGTIVIEHKQGRRGAFSVGTLNSEIGEFEVKDPVIEEFEPGKYTGEFLITWIEPESFTWKGRVFVKIRAKVAEVFIDEGAEGHVPPLSPPEPDPLDTSAAVGAEVDAAIAKASTRAKRQPAPAAPEPAGSASTSGSSAGATGGVSGGDRELFGLELAALIEQQAVVKLDPTIDRVQFRAQRDRLKALGYSFDAKSQEWSMREHETA